VDVQQAAAVVRVRIVDHAASADANTGRDRLELILDEDREVGMVVLLGQVLFTVQQQPRFQRLSRRGFLS